MSLRPVQPEPFIRGCLYKQFANVPYPRARPADAEQLPVDVWAAAQVPAGVRLELVGDAEVVQISYTTATANLGYRGEGAGCTFIAYRAGQKIGECEAVLGDGVAQIELYGDPERPVIIYLPEGMRPTIQSVTGLRGDIAPAPPQPRWLAYGDAVTQGWLASSPAMAWPAVVGRKLGLDLCNLGYAGSARGEMSSAVTLADTSAEAISIAFGHTNWGRVPHTPSLFAEEVRAFVKIVRDGHPKIPIVVVSPTLRPDAEDSPNRLGATLSQLRIAMEDAVRELILAGDVQLMLVEGGRVISEADLEDGVYPGDEGHKRLAAAVSKYFTPLLGELRQDALARRQEDAIAQRPGISPAAESYSLASPASEPRGRQGIGPRASANLGSRQTAVSSRSIDMGTRQEKADAGRWASEPMGAQSVSAPAHGDAKVSGLTKPPAAKQASRSDLRAQTALADPIATILDAQDVVDSVISTLGPEVDAPGAVAQTHGGERARSSTSFMASPTQQLLASLATEPVESHEAPSELRSEVSPAAPAAQAAPAPAGRRELPEPGDAYETYEAEYDLYYASEPVGSEPETMRVGPFAFAEPLVDDYAEPDPFAPPTNYTPPSERLRQATTPAPPARIEAQVPAQLEPVAQPEPAAQVPAQPEPVVPAAQVPAQPESVTQPDPVVTAPRVQAHPEPAKPAPGVVHVPPAPSVAPRVYAGADPFAVIDAMFEAPAESPVRFQPVQHQDPSQGGPGVGAYGQAGLGGGQPPSPSQAQGGRGSTGQGGKGGQSNQKPAKKGGFLKGAKKH